MIPGPDYDRLEREARLENLEELRSDLNANHVQGKIRNWAQKFGLEPEFVRFKVLTDDTFAMQFAKEPSRQSLHQKIAARHIRQNIPFVQGFSTPPAGGNTAEYVVRGMAVPGGNLHPATNNHGKSIDFKWVFEHGGAILRVYATHKHTKEEGGSQDNQFADVRRFLEEAQDCRDPDILFLALCDGAYYQCAYDGRRSRLTALNEDHPGRRSKACTVNELPRVYAEFIERWLEHHNLGKTAPIQQALLNMKGAAEAE